VLAQMVSCQSSLCLGDIECASRIAGVCSLEDLAIRQSVALIMNELRRRSDAYHGWKASGICVKRLGHRANRGASTRIENGRDGGGEKRLDPSKKVTGFRRRHGAKIGPLEETGQGESMKAEG
jgi:hypothetical protein